MNYIQNLLNHFLVSSAPVPDGHIWNKDKTTQSNIFYSNTQHFHCQALIILFQNVILKMSLINNRAKTIVLLKHSSFMFYIGKWTTYIVRGRQDVELPSENVPLLHLRHTVSWDAVPVSINIAVLKPDISECLVVAVLHSPIAFIVTCLREICWVCICMYHCM